MMKQERELASHAAPVLEPLFHKSGQTLRRERRKAERKLRWKRYLDAEKKLNQKREKMKDNIEEMEDLDDLEEMVDERDYTRYTLFDKIFMAFITLAFVAVALFLILD